MLTISIRSFVQEFERESLAVVEISNRPYKGHSERQREEVQVQNTRLCRLLSAADTGKVAR